MTLKLKDALTLLYHVRGVGYPGGKPLGPRPTAEIIDAENVKTIFLVFSWTSKIADPPFQISGHAPVCCRGKKAMQASVLGGIFW